MNRLIAVTTADDIAPAYRNLMARRELFIGGLVEQAGCTWSGRAE
jgi:hypothetical protein